MKRVLPVHPVLFGAFPILFLYAQNVRVVSASQVITPLLLVVAVAIVGHLALAALLRSSHKAGLVVSLTLVLFLSYGHFHRLLVASTFTLGGVRIGPCKMLGPLWLAAWVLGTWFAVRARRDLRPASAMLNVVALVLVVIPAVQIGAFALRARSAGALALGGDPKGAPDGGAPAGAVPPNIFYIILDGYGRADVLKEIYGHDNGEFLDWLRGKGFFVADKCCSNYAQTSLSLAATLNLGYLDELVSRVGADCTDREPLTRRLRHPRVVEFLRRRGYQWVAFSSGYSPTETDTADVYLTPAVSINEFQAALVNTTALRVVFGLAKLLRPRTQSLDQRLYAQHRERVRYTLDALVRMQERPGPLVVFAHLFPPHPPFVFGPDGEDVDPPWPYFLGDGSHWAEQPGATREMYLRGYRDQLRFLNARIRTMVEGLLAKATRPTIILLQGDHGPGSRTEHEAPERTDMRERFGILNACYVPQGGAAKLYDAISPVNTFRVILNHYFGTTYDLLPDKSYFSTWEHPFRLTDVTGSARLGLDAPRVPQGAPAAPRARADEHPTGR